MVNVARGVWLASILAVAVGCGGGGGSSVDPTAAAICQQAKACGFVDSSQMAACEAELAVMGMYVANTDRTVSCVQDLTCDELNDQQYVVDTCIAYDTEAFTCQDQDHLTICNVYDECKTISCNGACRRFYGVSGACGFNADPSYDYYMCLCGVGASGG